MSGFGFGFGNASKLRRNIQTSLQQENTRIFFSKQENKLTEKNFLVPSARRFDLN